MDMQEISTLIQNSINSKLVQQGVLMLTPLVAPQPFQRKLTVGQMFRMQPLSLILVSLMHDGFNILLYATDRNYF